MCLHEKHTQISTAEVLLENLQPSIRLQRAANGGYMEYGACLEWYTSVDSGTGQAHFR